MARALQQRVAPIPEAFAQSLVGLLIWAVSMALVQPGWSPALLAFGPLVIYPLLMAGMGAEWIELRRLSMLAFLPALTSYAWEPGALAGALALPWFLFTLVILWHRFGAEVRARQYAMVLLKGYLVVGASWLVLARLGQRPLGFSDAIVHATAVHFHYAGFVLPILALHWLRAAPSPRRYVLVAALLLGMPLVALGITLSAFGIGWIELATVWFFVLVCTWFAVEQIRFAFTLRSAWPRGLLVISSLSLSVAMTLAFLYATGNYWRFDWLDIPLMLRSHGPIQVLGFALPAVVAWNIVQREYRI